MPNLLPQAEAEPSYPVVSLGEEWHRLQYDAVDRDGHVGHGDVGTALEEALHVAEDSHLTTGEYRLASLDLEQFEALFDGREDLGDEEDRGEEEAGVGPTVQTVQGNHVLSGGAWRRSNTNQSVF